MLKKGIVCLIMLVLLSGGLLFSEDNPTPASPLLGRTWLGVGGGLNLENLELRDFLYLVESLFPQVKPFLEEAQVEGGKVAINFHLGKNAGDKGNLWEGSLRIEEGALKLKRPEVSLSDIQLTMEFSAGKINISQLNLKAFGGDLKGKGTLALNPQRGEEIPPSQRLTFTLKGINVSRLLTSFSPESSPLIALRGRASGEVALWGGWRNPRYQGELRLGKGRWGNISFQKAVFPFQGRKYLLYLKDALLSQKEGGIILTRGRIDLRGEKGLGNNLKYYSRGVTYTWQDWEIKTDYSALYLGKELGNKWSVDLMAPLNGSESDNLPYRKGRFGLNYELEKHQTLMMYWEGEEEFFGLKHGFKF